MKFQYKVIPRWPPLAWVAELAGDSASIRVRHGEWVETREPWFCEAVWAGEFADGDFDATDIVAGSGVRIRGDRLLFVASGSNLDRLHVLRSPDATFVSNSLCCLLARVDGHADLGHLEYTQHFSSYRYSIFGDYSRIFPSSAGPIEITYFANLSWDGTQLAQIEKPHAVDGFGSFAEYREFVRRSMTLLARNAGSPDRSRPFKLLCSISKGYDSPAVAVIAADVADLEAFTFARDREGRDDSGASIAASLGVPCHVVDRNAWRTTPLPEVPFIAGSGSVGDMAFKSAESLLRGSVLLNGANGVPVWKRDAQPAPDVEVGDGNLLGLSEYRIWTGFVSCSVPSWGIRHLRDIVRLSNSAEMKPWDVGGAYNKPIPRRILEEAGIDRHRFATGKSGVSVVPSARSEYLIPSSRRDLLDWLAAQRRDGRRSLPSPHLARLLDAVITPVSKAVSRLALLCRDTNLVRFGVVRYALRHLRRHLDRPYYHHRYMIHWAVGRATQRYGRSEPQSPM